MCVMQCENTQVTFKKQTCHNWKVLFRASWLAQKLSWQVKIFAEVSIQNTKNTPHPHPHFWLCLGWGVVLRGRHQIRSYMQGSIPVVHCHCGLTCRFTLQHVALWEASTSRKTASALQCCLSVNNLLLKLPHSHKTHWAPLQKQQRWFFTWLCCLLCTSNSSWVSTQKERSLAYFFA